MAGTRSILIIEDDPLIAAHLEELLQLNGYKVVGVATEFETALALAEEHHPNVAIVDVKLIGSIDGVTIGRELASRHDTALIFVTGNLDQVLRSLTDIKAEFVGKPFSDEEILSGVDRAFATV